MIAVSGAVKIKVDELMTALDRDIELLEMNLERLDSLRAALIKRDERLMKELLGNVKDSSGVQSANDSKRERIRFELAELLGCGAADLTVTMLITIMPEDQSQRLMEKKSLLLSLTSKLNQEHVNTGMLLAEYTKLNRLFLNKIFADNKTDSQVYNSRGAVSSSSDAAFMNLKL